MKPQCRSASGTPGRPGHLGKQTRVCDSWRSATRTLDARVRRAQVNLAWDAPLWRGEYDVSPVAARRCMASTATTTLAIRTPHREYPGWTW